MNTKTSFKPLPQSVFLLESLPYLVFFREGMPNETTLWVSMTPGTKLYRSFCLSVVISCCINRRVWVGFLLLSNVSFIGCLMNYVVKIVLDCSNDLKVKKTPRCTAESHKSVVSNSRLWAGRLLRGRQAHCLPGCSVPSMLEWQCLSLCELEAFTTPVHYRFVFSYNLVDFKVTLFS